MAFVVKYEERREKQKKSYSPSVRALSLSSNGTPSEDFTGGYSRALPPVLKRPSPPAPPQPSVGAARSFVRVSSFSVLSPSKFCLLLSSLSFVSSSVLSPDPVDEAEGAYGRRRRRGPPPSAAEGFYFRIAARGGG